MTSVMEPVMDHTQEIQQAAFEAKKAEMEREKVFARLGSLRVEMKETLDQCHTIPDSELSEQIAQRFRMWDLDHSGALDRHELTEALAELGKRPTEETMDDFMAKYDLDGNGTIELDEFEKMVRYNIGCRQSPKALEEQAQEVIAAEEEVEIVSKISIPTKKGTVSSTPRRAGSGTTPRVSGSTPRSKSTPNDKFFK